MPSAFLDTIVRWPNPAQERFVAMRGIILRAGQGAGRIGESLKWGEPAWRPVRPRQGSTLRLNWSPGQDDTMSLFVNCRTTLVETMRDIYPDSFVFDGNRALRLPLAGALPENAIDHLARLTFNYHRTI